MREVKQALSMLLLSLAPLFGLARPASADPVAQSDSTLRRVHNALFEAWLPADSLPLPDGLRAQILRLNRA